VVPVDSELLSPEASLDESSLTGDSLPVTHRTGDALLSGSLNGGVAILIRATARVEDSQYQRIVALVEEASQSRAPLVRLADRYAVPFTAVSLLIAGIAWWVSGDPDVSPRYSCWQPPCPLLIAAPVAFMGGMSRAARDGIIVKSGGTLEQLAQIRTVAFDKTGTLTYGQPTLDAVNPVPPLTADELLTLAASAEQYSSHVSGPKSPVPRSPAFGFWPKGRGQLDSGIIAQHWVERRVAGVRVLEGKGLSTPPRKGSCCGRSEGGPAVSPASTGRWNSRSYRGWSRLPWVGSFSARKTTTRPSQASKAPRRTTCVLMMSAATTKWETTSARDRSCSRV
jgi:E1-E2 ATPase